MSRCALEKFIFVNHPTVQIISGFNIDCAQCRNSVVNLSLFWIKNRVIFTKLAYSDNFFAKPFFVCVCVVLPILACSSFVSSCWGSLCLSLQLLTTISGSLSLCPSALYVRWFQTKIQFYCEFLLNKNATLIFIILNSDYAHH